MADSGRPFEGVIPAVPTPMSEGGEGVDLKAIHSLVDFLVGSHVGGILIGGSTGEVATLTRQERLHITDAAIGAARGRVPTIVHTTALSTREAVTLSVHAEKAGAAAVMVLPPFYEPLSWEELTSHFKAISDAISIPIVLYNLPMAAGIKISPERVGEIIAEVPNVRYVKDSTGDAVALTELIHRYGDQVSVMNGWDTLTFYGLAAGTRACIWGAATFMPARCVQLFDTLVRTPDLAIARRIWADIWPICAFLEQNGYVRGVKAACDLVGIPLGGIRAPYQPLAGGLLAQLTELLRRADLLPVSAGSREPNCKAPDNLAR